MYWTRLYASSQSAEDGSRLLLLVMTACVAHGAVYVTLLLCCTGRADPPATDGAAAAVDVEGEGKDEGAVAKRGREEPDTSDAGPSQRARKGEAGEGPADVDQDKEQRRGSKGVGGSAGQQEAAEGKGEGEEEEWDVTAGMNPRQKKLYLLQRKAAKARKANEHAAVAEAKRVRAGPPDTHLERKKWLDKQRKEKEVCFCHC